METEHKNITKNAVVSANGNKYYPIIGLEIHAELKTRSKMFCSCKNDPDEETPNKNICAICMGHPGTLPTLNKEAIKHVIRVGTAVGADIADYTEWDRKNYFYPDIPKGYQISQYAFPLVKNGSIKVRGVNSETGEPLDQEVLLTRIHLEEDTAKSSHDKGDYSLVDFNRAGLPLMELVTEPVIHDSKTAANFAKELQLLLRTLGAGDANMEKGEMRVEANISVSTDPAAHNFPYDIKTFGKKVEIKNLNSFRSAERAIEYEIKRHIDLIERGEKIVQETRGFDETTNKTFSQRAKEDSHDYRYFPDPDLPKLFTSEIPDFDLKKIAESLPILPWILREKYKKDYEMKDEDAEMFLQNSDFKNFFEAVVAGIEKLGILQKENIKLAINYITSDIAGLVKKASLANNAEVNSANVKANDKNYEIKISPEYFAEIIAMISASELSSRGAKDLIALYWSEDTAALEQIANKSPKKIAEECGMIQKNDPEALKTMINELLTANPTVLADYKAGKEASLQFFIGQIMKNTKGSVNPQLAKTVLLEIIASL